MEIDINMIKSKNLTFSSMVPVLSSRYNTQGLVCPSLHTRAWACKSADGLKQESKSTRRLPPTRFRPCPPARVLTVFEKEGGREGRKEGREEDQTEKSDLH